ncbi:MAG: hypothetical protein KDD43_08235, partial [Bdellovibrionales bacterium]|nr:hypothetical protein [Bdellovibrionales bacterium]
LRPAKGAGGRWGEFSRAPNGKVSRIRNHYENSERHLGFTAFVDHNESLSSIRYHRLQGQYHEVPIQDLQNRHRRTDGEVKVTPQRMRKGEQIIQLFAIQKEAIEACCQDQTCVESFDRKQSGLPGTDRPEATSPGAL